MRRRLALFLSLTALGILLSLYPLRILSLETQGRILTGRIVCPGDTFQLGYLHSVAKSDVWDTFEIDSQGRILLVESRFQGQAYGLPGGPEGKERWTREGDWFRITGMQRLVSSIDWRIQSEWKDRFRFNHEPLVDVSAQVGSGLIHIQVKKARLIDWLGFYMRQRLQI
jgi:hypothetical protein